MYFQFWQLLEALQMVNLATSPFCLWRRNMQSVLQMGGKMAGFGVQQPMITRKIKSGASVKVSKLVFLIFVQIILNSVFSYILMLFTTRSRSPYCVLMAISCKKWERQSSHDGKYWGRIIVQVQFLKLLGNLAVGESVKLAFWSCRSMEIWQCSPLYLLIFLYASKLFLESILLKEEPLFHAQLAFEQGKE